MVSVFVTGATGFLGLNLIECLAEKSWDVTVLHRPNADLSCLRPFETHTVEGDITDPVSLAKAIPSGIDYIFHMAADISVLKKDRDRQKSVNIGGTDNLIDAAMAAGARRFIYTSSASTYGPHKKPINEQTEQTGIHSPIHYVQTKSRAENCVRAAMARGLNAVICNPGHIIGRHDQHGWARLFLRIKADTLIGIPPGSGSFAHAREVAKAHITAAERGKCGENYILGGPHMTFAALIREIGGLMNKVVSSGTMPGYFIKLNACFSEYRARAANREPAISLDAARLVCQHHILDSSKAEQELGYNPPPIRTALSDCYRGLAENGLI